jgi:hypothetical protein
MPRRLRRTVHRLTVGQEDWLVTGGAFSGATLRREFEGDMELAKEAWARHRERLMREFRQPGRRVYAWWLFEAPPWRHLIPGAGKPPPRGLRLVPGAAGMHPVRPYDEPGILGQLGLLDEVEKADMRRVRAGLA